MNKSRIRAAAEGALGLLVLASTATAQVSWTNRGPVPLNHGLGSAMAQRVAPAGNTIVAFGGAVGAAYVATTSVYAGSAWTTVTPPASPPARANHAMATIGTGVLLFGGSGAAGPLGDTWLYDGTTWTQIGGAQPPSRHGHDMVPFNGGIVLFGGVDAVAYLADTWFFNGSTWQQLNIAAPGARYAHSMAQDPVTGEVVLFGGIAPGGGQLNDTYTLRLVGGQPQWFAENPTNQPSAGFGNHSLPMVTDTYRRRVVLVDALGGFVNGQFGNTWEWDVVARNWTLRPVFLAGLRGAHAFLQRDRQAVEPGVVIVVQNNATNGYSADVPGRFVTGGTSAGPRIQLDPGYADVTWKGETMTITAGGFATGGSAPQLVISAGLYSPPIDMTPFGAPGYFLYADPNQGVTVPTALNGSVTSASFVVPQSTALLATLYFQFHQYVPAANPLQLVFTDYAVGTVGAK